MNALDNPPYACISTATNELKHFYLKIHLTD